MGQPGGVHHPLHVRIGLDVVSEIVERIGGERRIAQPAVAVIPVSGSTDPFRQGGGWSGNDRSGRGKGHQLEQQGTAEDDVAVLSIVAKMAGPGLPEIEGPVDLIGSGIPNARNHRRGIAGPAQGEVHAVPRPHGEPGYGRALLDSHLHGRAQIHHAVVADRVNQARTPRHQLRGAPAIVRPGLVDHLHFDLPLDSFQPSENFAEGEQMSVLVLIAESRHQIEHANGPVGTVEGRFQDVRIIDVMPLGPEVARGTHPEKTTPVCIEDPCEDRRALELRPAAPVDRAIRGDQCGRTAVADDAVVGDGAVIRLAGTAAQGQCCGRRGSGSLLFDGHRVVQIGTRSRAPGGPFERASGTVSADFPPADSTRARSARRVFASGASAEGGL